MEIPLVPGMHHSSRVGKSAADSLVITGYIVPIALISPYAAGVIVADTLVWGRYPMKLDDAKVLSPETMAALGEGATERRAASVGSG